MLRRLLLTCVARENATSGLHIGRIFHHSKLSSAIVQTPSTLKAVSATSAIKLARMCSTEPPGEDEIMEMLSQIPTGEDVSGEFIWENDLLDDSFEDVGVNKETITSLPGHLLRGILVPNKDTHSAIIAGQRYDQLPIAHIRATYQNTLVTITEHTGSKWLGRASGGTVGFKNAKKKTTIAAQAAGLAAAQFAMKHGITHVRVALNGIGKGRLPACKGLEEAGLTIVSLTDVSIIDWGTNMPKKRRKL